MFGNIDPGLHSNYHQINRAAEIFFGAIHLGTVSELCDLSYKEPFNPIQLQVPLYGQRTLLHRISCIYPKNISLSIGRINVATAFTGETTVRRANYSKITKFLRRYCIDRHIYILTIHSYYSVLATTVQKQI